MKQYQWTSKECFEIIENGYVLSFPTETVYGVGISWKDEKAYERLVQAKKRRPDKPIAIMCSPSFPLEEYFEISPGAKRVMEKFLPGPLTCLVKAKDNTPYQVHLGTFVAGIRIPDKKELLTFLEKVGHPLQVTSANLSGTPSLTRYEDVYETFKDSEEVQGIIKGECQSGVATTVVVLYEEKPRIVREGEIALSEIEEAFYAK